MTTLPTTQIPGTNVSLTRMSLGGAPLGAMYLRMQDDQAVATVDRAWDVGIRTFDTAPLYGLGSAERRLGLAVKRFDRAAYTASTKVGRVIIDDGGRRSYRFDYSAEGVRQSLAASHLRTGLDRFDTVFVHDPEKFMDDAIGSALPELRRLQDDGRIGAVGAGMNYNEPLRRFVEAGLVDCVLVAGRLTLLDQSALDELLPAAARADVAVIAAGVFNSGVLADPDADPTLVNYDYKPAPAEVVERARRVARVCRDHDVTLVEAALQFPLLHPSVVSVLVGCRSAAEVDANASALSKPIPSELWRALVDADLLVPTVLELER